MQEPIPTIGSIVQVLQTEPVSKEPETDSQDRHEFWLDGELQIARQQGHAKTAQIDPHQVRMFGRTGMRQKAKCQSCRKALNNRQTDSAAQRINRGHRHVEQP